MTDYESIMIKISYLLRQMMQLFPANLSLLDNMKNRDIRSLLSLEAYDGARKRLVCSTCIS